MAVAFGACSSGNTTGTSLTFAHTCATGSVLYVFVGIDDTSNWNPTVAYNGDAMTLITEDQTTSYKACFRLLTPDTGSAYNVVVSGLPSGGEEIAFAISVTVVDNGDPDDTPELANDAGTPSALSDAVTTAANDMVLSLYATTLGTSIVSAHAGSGGATIPTNGILSLTSTTWAVTYLLADAASETPGITWTGGSPCSMYSINVNAAAGASSNGAAFHYYRQSQ